MKDGTIVSGRSTGAGRAEVLPSNLAHVTAVVPQEKQRLEVLRRFMHTEPFPESCVVFVNEQHRVEVGARRRAGAGAEAVRDGHRGGAAARRRQQGGPPRGAPPPAGRPPRHGGDDGAGGARPGRAAAEPRGELRPAHGRGALRAPRRPVWTGGQPGHRAEPGHARTRFVAEKFARQLRVPFQEVEIKHARILLREQEVQSNAAQEGEEK
ncbi:unnamed protein product [Heterosigma akashiwo]